MEWILASASPRRRELLAQVIADFSIAVADVEEWEADEADPAELVAHNAQIKAAAVALHFPDARILAADTTVALGRKVFHKPRDRSHAIEMLQELAGRRHTVYTGVEILLPSAASGTGEHSRITFVESSEVWFRPLDLPAIEKYLDHTHVLDKAGAYAVQENRDWIIERFSGSLSNIMGLPLERLRHELENGI